MSGFFSSFTLTAYVNFLLFVSSQVRLRTSSRVNVSVVLIAFDPGFDKMFYD